MRSVDDKPRVKHGATGRLFAQDGLSVLVSIAHRGDQILLEIEGDADEFTAGPLSYLMLESAGARGIVRTPGTGELVSENLLRFVLDDTAELVQRRDFVRVTAAKRVVLENEKGDVLADALTVDISGGGMLVRLRKPVELPAGGTMYFTLYLGLTDYDDQVSGTVDILRRQPDKQVALVFRHISRTDQERLIRFVFERQRVALRVTRGDTI